MRRMRSTREYTSLMKFQNCTRFDVMDADVFHTSANGTKMKDAVADASEHPKESGVRLTSKLDAEMTNRRGTRMRKSIRLASPVSPRLSLNENECVNCVRDIVVNLQSATDRYNLYGLQFFNLIFKCNR